MKKKRAIHLVVCVGLLFIAGLIVMLVLGILACDDAVKSEYYCPTNACTHDTGHYVTNTSMNWGPCGLGYGSSSSSTCEMYCGNQTGVVCAYMNYDCVTGKNTSSYYCSNALTHCTDCSEVRRACFNPTPSPLIVIPVVFLTLILYVLAFICKLSWFSYDRRARNNNMIYLEADINAVASDVRKRSDSIIGELSSQNLVVPLTSDSFPEPQSEPS
mmetsp:Transcript_24043/g.26311  ORF Transcript_24043/g.26311 Transcript_24043/m.26311 type:complete len:215 (-) Transcript_24043:97-741(-)